MIALNRRSLLRASLAAPAIIGCSSLMPLRGWAMGFAHPGPLVHMFDDANRLVVSMEAPDGREGASYSHTGPLARIVRCESSNREIDLRCNGTNGGGGWLINHENPIHLYPGDTLRLGRFVTGRFAVRPVP